MPRVEVMERGGMGPARNGATRALDVVVVLSVLVAGVRIPELAALPNPLVRTIAYTGGLAAAVALWIG